MQEVLPVLEATLAANSPLLIMALDVTGDALSGLVLNTKKGVVQACATKTPGFGDVRSQYLQDICIFSGAKFFTSELGLKPEDVKLEDLGKLDKVVISKRSTLMVSTGDYVDAVEARVATLREQIGAKIEQGREFEVQRLEQRIIKLRGAVARIYIGGATEVEIEDKRLRYEDAINALKGAIAEGMVPGGGSCYAYMTRYMDEVRRALTPLGPSPLCPLTP